MKHFLNDIEVAPRNLTDIGVVSDFNQNPDILQVSVDSVILPREAKDIITEHIANVGLFEGIPYRIEVGGVTIDYYVDLIDGVKVRQHEIEVNIKKRKSLDNFFSRAEGTSFELMAKNGVVFDTYEVPYFIIPDNQAELFLQLALVTYLMAKETFAVALALAEDFANLQEASTPIPGLSPAGPVVSFNVGAIVRASLIIIARFVYLALLLGALIDFAQQLFLVAFPPKRYLKGTYVKELCTKTCEYFGYTFASDLLDAEPHWAICPVPLINNRESFFDTPPSALDFVYNNGYPSSSDTTPTALALFRGLETMLNARTIVRGGEVRLERRDWLQNQTTLQLLPALSLQSGRDDEFTYNTEEVWKRYYIHYQTDFQDLYTLDGKVYDYSDAEFSTEATFPVTNEDLLMIRGLNDVNIPFALANRKSELTWLESFAKGVLIAIDFVTGLFGGGTNFGPQVNSRKDAMRISQQYFSVTKILYGELSAVKPGEIIQQESYSNVVSASALWNRYHYINAIQNNAYIIKENVRVRITPQDFVSLLDNNYAEIDGVLCEILQLEWIDEKSFAQITYKCPSGWADNKVQTIIIDD